MINAHVRLAVKPVCCSVSQCFAPRALKIGSCCFHLTFHVSDVFSAPKATEVEKTRSAATTGSVLNSGSETAGHSFL